MEFKGIGESMGEERLHPDGLNYLEKKELCYGCVGQKYLSDEIRSQGKRRKCSYCGKVSRCYQIGEMASRIDKVFTEHYTRTPDEPTSWQYTMLSDKESNYVWIRDGEPVVCAIMNAAEIPEEAAEDIQQILDGQYGDIEASRMGEETEFSSDSYYEEKGMSDAFWQEEWQSFEHSLKTKARFFSQTAANHLSRLAEVF